MPWQAKFSVQRGKVQLQNVAVAAGAAEPQTDSMSVNIDTTVLTKGEALMMIDNIKAKIHAMPWPPL